MTTHALPTSALAENASSRPWSPNPSLHPAVTIPSTRPVKAILQMLSFFIGLSCFGWGQSTETPYLQALRSASAKAPGYPIDLGAAITPTQNPQVALYTLHLPVDAKWRVDFGPTTDYGLITNSVASDAYHEKTSVYVAGMQANTLYHMRATITLKGGFTIPDIDHTFTTGALPPFIAAYHTTATTAGLTPQPGIELIDLINGATNTAALATDLAGNIIWTYTPPDRQPSSILYPIKLLPNGHFLMEINPSSQLNVAGPTPPNTLVELREIDLAGNIIKQLSMADLNQRLVTAGFTGLTLQVYSHDVLQLPNGHLLLIANTIKPYTDLVGYPGTTNVVGDVVVDLDKNWNPVWVWNEFDHLDVNRHPMNFPDWTHSNALVYSADDGNFLISVRHQNWVIKVNYKNGAGDGSIVWKLGYQGDFTLLNGTDPTDWFYAQHYPSLFSKNSTGVFSLGLMDNGDDRVFPDGSNCQVQGGTLCYTTIPVFQVDEKAMTATIVQQQILPPNLYSSFAGNTDLLANGNIEYTLSGVGPDSYTFEVTPGNNPETVWQQHIVNTNSYRALRIPSLYPGVQW